MCTWSKATYSLTDPFGTDILSLRTKSDRTTLTYSAYFIGTLLLWQYHWHNHAHGYLALSTTKSIAMHLVDPYHLVPVVFHSCHLSNLSASITCWLLGTLAWVMISVKWSPNFLFFSRLGQFAEAIITVMYTSNPFNQLFVVVLLRPW